MYPGVLMMCVQSPICPPRASNLIAVKGGDCHALLEALSANYTLRYGANGVTDLTPVSLLGVLATGVSGDGCAFTDVFHWLDSRFVAPRKRPIRVRCCWPSSSSSLLLFYPLCLARFWGFKALKLRDKITRVPL